MARCPTRSWSRQKNDRCYSWPAPEAPSTGLVWISFPAKRLYGWPNELSKSAYGPFQQFAQLLSHPCGLKQPGKSQFKRFTIVASNFAFFEGD